MILCCSLWMAAAVQAQDVPVGDSSAKTATDTIQYRIDKELGRQVEKQKEVNKKSPTIEGFRVQVYSGNSRQNATQIRADVLDKFPEYAAYLSYRQPNFRVRVGDFKSRFEAQKLLNDLKPLYPTSFIVPDEVLVNPVLTPKNEEPANAD